MPFADMSWVDVCDADFSGAKLFRARFHRVKNDRTIMPFMSGSYGDDEELANAEDFKSPY